MCYVPVNRSGRRDQHKGHTCPFSPLDKEEKKSIPRASTVTEIPVPQGYFCLLLNFISQPSGTTSQPKCRTPARKPKPKPGYRMLIIATFQYNSSVIHLLPRSSAPDHSHRTPLPTARQPMRTRTASTPAHPSSSSAPSPPSQNSPSASPGSNPTPCRNSPPSYWSLSR